MLYLSRRKANYAPQDWRRFKFADGILVPEVHTQAVRYGGEYAKDGVLRAVTKLKGLEIFGNASTRSPEFLPKLAADYKLLDGLSKRQFADAMRELVVEKRLKSERVGQYPNRSPKFGLVPT